MWIYTTSNKTTTDKSRQYFTVAHILLIVLLGRMEDLHLQAPTALPQATFIARHRTGLFCLFNWLLNIGEQTAKVLKNGNSLIFHLSINFQKLALFLFQIFHKKILSPYFVFYLFIKHLS